jgi:hypothetical protein
LPGIVGKVNIAKRVEFPATCRLWTPREVRIPSGIHRLPQCRNIPDLRNHGALIIAARVSMRISVTAA